MAVLEWEAALLGCCCFLCFKDCFKLKLVQTSKPQEPRGQWCQNLQSLRITVSEPPEPQDNGVRTSRSFGLLKMFEFYWPFAPAPVVHHRPVVSLHYCNINWEQISRPSISLKEPVLSSCYSFKVQRWLVEHLWSWSIMQLLPELYLTFHHTRTSRFFMWKHWFVRLAAVYLFFIVPGRCHLGLYCHYSDAADLFQTTLVIVIQSSPADPHHQLLVWTNTKKNQKRGEKHCCATVWRW